MMYKTRSGLGVRNFGKFNSQHRVLPHTYRGEVEVSKGKWESAEWGQDGKCITHVGDEYFIGQTRHTPVTRDEMIHFTKDEKLEKAFFFVEGKDYDAWKEYSKKEGVEWTQDGSGWSQQLGCIYRKKGKKYEAMPVMISFSFAIINGVYVCFYTSTSQVVDWKMVEDYIEQFAGQYDSASRRAMVDIDNFHNCMHYCEKPH